MSTLSNKLVAICLVTVISMVMYGCGGGGGGSSDDEMPGDGGGMMPTPEPDPEPTGPTQAEIDEEAMRVAGALGGTATDPNVNVRTGLPGAAVESMGKVTTGMMPTDFMEDAETQYTAISGWDSNAYTQTNQAGNVKVTGVLYSNVDAPTAQRYAQFFGGGGAGLIADVVTSAAVGATDDGTITFNANGFDAGMNANKFASDGFPSTPNTITDFPADDDETDAIENETAGSFFGIPGTFKCAAGGCTVRTNAEGALTQFTGAWTFTPTRFTEGDGTATPPTGTMVQGVVDDPDYMVFGYWLEETTARDGEVTYKVNVYQRGQMAYDATASVGTATYEGPATGIYMKKTVDPNGEPTSPFSSGQFTADAMLVASFGGGTVGTDHEDTVTGTITNFVDSTGASIADWTLTLNRTDDTATGNAINDGTFAGTTSGYKNGPEGAYAGGFYGPARGTGDPVTNPHPASTAGTFNGHFKNGHVAGAFGATKQAN